MDSGERGKEFVADLALHDYDLPSDAPVWMEAYDRYAVLRFSFGTVANPRPERSCVISEFSGTDTCRFRVKVIDPNDRSKLLAIAKHINPASPHDENAPAYSLLKLASDDLRGRPWKLEFAAGTYPTLFIDRSFDAGTSLARLDIFFQGAIFPQITEMVLEKILLGIDRFSPSDEIDPDDEWKAAWIQFVETLPGVAKLEADTEITEDILRDWIDDAVEAFSKNFSAIRKMRIDLGEIET
ncbi:MAG: hypothetical protein ACHQ1H_03035 [Nitrososphaerales archaeon]